MVFRSPTPAAEAAENLRRDIQLATAFTSGEIGEDAKSVVYSLQATVQQMMDAALESLAPRGAHYSPGERAKLALRDRENRTQFVAVLFGTEHGERVGNLLRLDQEFSMESFRQLVASLCLQILRDAVHGKPNDRR